MSFVEISRGPINWKTRQSYTSTAVEVEEKRSWTFSVALEDSSFIRLYEYVLITPIITNDEGTFTSSEVHRYYPIGLPMLFSINVPELENAGDYFVAVSCIPKLRYTGTTPEGDQVIIVSWEDNRKVDYAGSLVGS